MNANIIRSVGLACVGVLFSSCASSPYYGNSSYRGQSRGGIDPVKTGALVAAGIAGLSLYHYGKEKDKRKRAERQRDYDYRGRADRRGRGYDNRRYDDGRRYDNRGRGDRRYDDRNGYYRRR